MIKALGLAIMARKEELYELNYLTGATRKDGWIDIEGGAGTLFSFSSKGRRELPDAHVLLDGQLEGLSKNGTFVGQHIYTSLQGAAVHINAFNFPVWGMLEKLAPTLLAGVPAIVKPASATAYLTEAAFKIMIEAEHPAARRDPADRRRRRRPVRSPDRPGHRQLHRLGAHRAQAAARIRRSIRELVRFVAEQDSLNASLLGPDAAPGTPEFDLFIKEVATEMTVKAGQKCTAIRRAMAPAQYLDAVEQALGERLAKTKVGDPRAEDTRMGALVSVSQRDDVREKIARARSGRRADRRRRSECRAADRRRRLPAARAAAHRRSVDERRRPRLRAVRAGLDDHALPATSPMRSRSPTAGGAAWCCRCSRIRPKPRASSFRAPQPITAACWSSNRDQCRGIDRPRLAASGARPRRSRPSRRQRGDGRGARREALHAAHRAPVLAGDDRRNHRAICARARPSTSSTVHPFRLKMSELHIGDTWETPSRTITLEDIEHFAEFTGDKFYAHMDEEAAKASPIFEGRVAHGYLLLSFAAGLVRRSRSGAGARQHRAREFALPDPGLSRRIRSGSSSPSAPSRSSRRRPARCAGRSKSSTRRTSWSRPMTS